MALRLVLDAGHGMGTGGRRCLKSLDPKEHREWFLNQRIANYVEEDLKAYKDVVIYRSDDRTGKVDIPLTTRVREINKFKPNLVLSFHHDAGAKGTTAGGITTFRYTSSSQASKKYQESLYPILVKHTGLKGNRASPIATANFYIIKSTSAPAILIEHGFMDSRTDVPIIITDKFAMDCSKAYIEFLVKEFKLVKKVITPTKPTTPTNLYRVRKSWADAKSQLNAYANLDSAISEAKRNVGYKVFDSGGAVVFPVETKPTNPSSHIVPITGKAVASFKQMEKLLLSVNPSPKFKISPLEFCKIFIEEGEAEGIRGDIAFCQALHETGWIRFGGQVLPEQFNYCGLGATNNSPVGKGAWFKDEREGIRAQIQHLKAYANKEPLKNVNIDPRFNLVTRGIAPNWTDLNGRWAVPGTTYGQSILTLYDLLIKTKVESPVVNPIEKNLIEELKKAVLDLKEENTSTVKKYNEILDKLNKLK